MKKLYLIRHAKSSWADAALSDFDRPLNERGIKDAPRMAKRLKERRVVPDIILTSPANRALSTCLTFCEVLAFPTDQLHLEKNLYHADADQILNIVRSLKDRQRDDEENVMLFGHNPGLTEFTNAITGEYIDNIPTCGVVVCTFDKLSWREVSWRSARLAFFDFPKKEKD